MTVAVMRLLCEEESLIKISRWRSFKCKKKCSEKKIPTNTNNNFVVGEMMM
jgi:hypothetical protein